MPTRAHGKTLARPEVNSSEKSGKGLFTATVPEKAPRGRNAKPQHIHSRRARWGSLPPPRRRQALLPSCRPVCPKHSALTTWLSSVLTHSHNSVKYHELRFRESHSLMSQCSSKRPGRQDWRRARQEQRPRKRRLWLCRVAEAGRTQPEGLPTPTFFSAQDCVHTAALRQAAELKGVLPPARTRPPKPLSPP